MGIAIMTTIPPLRRSSSRLRPSFPVHRHEYVPTSQPRAADPGGGGGAGSILHPPSYILHLTPYIDILPNGRPPHLRVD